MKVGVFFRLLAALAVITFFSPANNADAAGKPIRFVIFAAGGPVDFVARTVAARLEKIIDAPVIVEARPGANGVVAANATISSTPDGTTLFFSSSGLFTISPTLSQLPFDPDKDLMPIGRVVTPVSALVIDANLPVKDLKEFVAYAKASKTPIQFGTPGIGNISQMWIEQFKASSGLKIDLVPYNGVAQVLNDVVGGRIAGTTGDGSAFMELASAGKVKILGIVGDNRSPASPDIPTLREQGFPGVDTVNWYGLFAPAKTPPEVIAQINKSVAQTLADPEVQGKLRAMGMEPSPSSPDDFRKAILADRAMLAKVIKDNNIRIEPAK